MYRIFNSQPVHNLVFNSKYNYLIFFCLDNIFLRIIVNWTMVSCYLYSPGMVSFAVQKIGNLSGLPSSYFKFTNIILLAAILNVIHIYTFILRVNHRNHWKSLVYYYPDCMKCIARILNMLLINLIVIQDWLESGRESCR